MTRLDTPSATPPELPLALTMGEPAGIGGEIALKSWKLNPHPPGFFLIDDIARIEGVRNEIGIDVPLRAITSPEDASDVFAEALPVFPCPLSNAATLGSPSSDTASSVIRSIELAVEFVTDGCAAAVVTNPIQKNVLYAAGFGFPGHTEFLAELAGIETPPVMMLACPGLRVVPVTVHVGLKEAIDALTADVIIERTRILHQSLRQDFAISDPVIAVSGLNPHAGEDGAMGAEETTIITPAIEALTREGIEAQGPYPPDTLFTQSSRETYDAAVCMYHDQALIPIKTLDFSGAVNVTLGLPIIRTSPDHGTATEIAGKGIADPSSLVNAMDLARRMAANRAVFEAAKTS